MAPNPQEIQSVDGTIRVVNTRADPIHIKSHLHIYQIRPVTVVEDVNLNHSDSTVCQLTNCDQPFSSGVSLDPDSCLSAQLVTGFKNILLKYDDIFDPMLSKYNGASGHIEAKVNMGPVLPPQRKGRLPQYNKSTLTELQSKFDELENMGVFVKPEDANITVEYLNVSFLVKKSSGGTRLVSGGTRLEKAYDTP